MSTSGMILKKVANFNPLGTLKEISYIMDSLGFNYCVDPIATDSSDFQVGINDPTCNADFCIYILDRPKPEYMKDDDFSWISPNLYVAIQIEDLYDCEDSVLKILHKYFSLHPNEYFYAEESWYYTKENIDRIYESGDWYFWCYKNPSLLK